MATTVTLGDSDLRSAVRVVASCIDDVPLYRWLLGEYLQDTRLREWLAEFMIRPLLRAGYVIGAEVDGEIVAVLAWQPLGVDLSPNGEPLLTVADVQEAAQKPGLRERLHELLANPPLPSPAPDAVNILVAAVLPEARRHGLLIDMIRPLEDYCATHRVPAYVWTAAPELGAGFLAGWDLNQFMVKEWNGMTMYGLVSDRLPRPRPPAGQRRAASPSAAPKA